MVVTSYGRNKNHEDEIKKLKDNESPSYRCAAINQSVIAAREHKTTRESEVLLKHRFLTLLKI